MIESALADGKIDPDFFDQQDVEEHYAAGGKPCPPTFRLRLDRYRSDYQKHLPARY